MGLKEYTIPDELTIYDKLGHEAYAKALREYIDAELTAKLTGKNPFKKKVSPIFEDSKVPPLYAEGIRPGEVKS